MFVFSAIQMQRGHVVCNAAVPEKAVNCYYYSELPSHWPVVILHIITQSKADEYSWKLSRKMAAVLFLFSLQYLCLLNYELPFFVLFSFLISSYVFPSQFLPTATAVNVCNCKISSYELSVFLLPHYYVHGVCEQVCFSWFCLKFQFQWKIRRGLFICSEGFMGFALWETTYPEWFRKKVIAHSNRASAISAAVKGVTGGEACHSSAKMDLKFKIKNASLNGDNCKN